VSPGSDAAPATDAGKTSASKESGDYDKALNLIKGGKYKEGLAAFTSFIKAYPNSKQLPSAYYWAASCRYQLKDYSKAAETFAVVAKRWPNDAKAPDALLGQGSAQQDAGDIKGAKKTYALLIKTYPKSAAAQSARQRLKKK